MTRDTTDYDSIYHRRLVNMDDEQLCQLEIHVERTARKFLGAANKHDASQEVVEHFAEQVRQTQNEL
jgi:hypothetical protein